MKPIKDILNTIGITHYNLNKDNSISISLYDAPDSLHQQLQDVMKQNDFTCVNQELIAVDSSNTYCDIDYTFI